MELKKLNILVFTSCYLPGYKSGGPIRSISNLVAALSHKFNFYIITSDRDLLDENSYPDIELNTWNSVGNAKVYYVEPSAKFFKLYVQLMKELDFDLIYLNSFFGFNFSILPLIVNKFFLGKNSLPVVLAPRGEFSEGALMLKSRKKKLFILLSKVFGLHNKLSWQASSSYEQSDIMKAIAFKKMYVKVAQNIPNVSLMPKSFKSEFNGEMKIIFISRLSPKKNLIFLLNILKELTFQIRFDIYGLVDDQNYWIECLKIIDHLPDNVKVNSHGPINHDLVMKKLSESHLFFLPTLGENFGHAIVESLLAGIPVLISTETPWRNLDYNNVGWDIPLSKPENFIQVLNKYYNEIQIGNFKDQRKIQNWILDKLEESNVLETNTQIFEDAIMNYQSNL